MSVRIQVPELKGYKVIKNSTLTPTIDRAINSRYWNSEGWSTIYDARYQDFYDLLKSGNFFLKRYHLANESNPAPAEFDPEISGENKERLKQVFAFLERKEKKPDPTVDKRNDPAFGLFEKDNTIIVGNRGFSIVGPKGTPRDGGKFANLPYAYPYPCDGVMNEYLGEVYSIVEDILDDGVFVLKSIDDMLEVYKSKDIEEMDESRMYLI